jgi:hypothetical protein
MGVMEKCTFCLHRTRVGRYPACAEVCPTGARKFGNLKDPNSWIEKGLGFVVPGFIPSTLGDFVRYLPSADERILCIGIWAFGLLIYTLFLKGAIPIVNQQNIR